MDIETYRAKVTENNTEHSVSELGRVFILIANFFRKKKIIPRKVPMYLVFPVYDGGVEAIITENYSNLSTEETESIGASPNGRKWLIPN